MRVSDNWNFFLSYRDYLMVFSVQCSMLLNVIEHVSIVHMLYCNGICSSVLYVIKCNRT